MLASGVTERVPQQVDHTRLSHRPRPDLRDRVREAFKAVADDHAHILDATVLQLGEHVQPVFGAFTAVAGPEPEDVAVALAGDRERDVDGPVGDLPVADLDVDGVDEDHRVDRVEGPVLPLSHAIDDLVGDRGDRLPRHLRAVDLAQVRGYLTGRQTLRRQRDDHLVDPGQPLLPLRDDLRVEAAFPVTGHPDLGPTSVNTVFERCPLREFPPSRPATSCLS